MKRSLLCQVAAAALVFGVMGCGGGSGIESGIPQDTTYKPVAIPDSMKGSMGIKSPPKPGTPGGANAK